MTELPCPPEQWPAFSRLLYEALDLPLERRAAWLDALPPEHAHLRARLKDVLDSAAKTDIPDFLQTPTVPDSRQSEFAAGQQIGPYTLERELGRGGMGEVWLALRTDGALSRRVALKLPHAQFLAGALRQRFERERDILASLSHPHIAALYDAGVSDGGYPYLAMEWVEGTQITRYCREAKISLDGRLALFRQVLDAVNYAHTRLIAHRDLKPANILVTADGQVKLLDFGIAKLLGDDTDGSSTELTRLGGRAITPNYAAPEQIAGQPITTAVDIYALGVVLFELLSGARPFDSGMDTRTGDTPLASRRVAGEHAEFVGGLDGVRLRKVLEGDLDAIVAKALETDPARRYRTAEAFTDDIDRYRRHEPISARRIGRLMLAGKFFRRHRLASSLAASLVLVLMFGSVAVAWEALRAQHAARLAEAAAQRAENETRREKATKDFLISVFKASDPSIPADKPRGTVTAKELLDASSDKIEKEFASDPETEVELLGLVANIYSTFDDSERVERLLNTRIEIARKHSGDLDPSIIDSMTIMADTAYNSGRKPRAMELLMQADALINRAGLNHSVQRAYWLLIKSLILGVDPAAQKSRQEMLENAVSLYAAVAPDNEKYPVALIYLSDAYLSHGDYSRAARYSRQAIDILSGLPSRDEVKEAMMYSSYGSVLRAQGDLEGAKQAQDHAVTLALRSYGSESEVYWQVRAQYAEIVHLLGDHVQADEIFQELTRGFPSAESGFRNKVVENKAGYVNLIYGRRLAAEGLGELAIPVLETSLRLFIAAPLDFWNVGQAEEELANAYLREGQPGKARGFLESSLRDGMMSQRPANDPHVLQRREVRGRYLLQSGELSKAGEQLREVIAQAGERSPLTVALAESDLARIAMTQHDAEGALRESNRAIETLDRISGARDVRSGPYLWRIRAEALLLSGDAKAARDLAQRALDADRRYDAPASTDIADAEATLRKVQAALISAK